ncbi:MAG: nuclear transport factor 2 family protein [Pseudomonadota bacterium]
MMTDIRKTLGTGVLLALVAHGATAKSCAQDYDFVAPIGHAQGATNVATLKKGLGAAAKGDFEAFMAIAADPYIQHSPDLPDGWKPVWDLTTNRSAEFSSKMIPWIGPNGFTDNGNYLVMFREVDHGDSSGAQKKFDLMYFDEDGLYAEHWDMAQQMSETTASGRSETAAAPQFTDAPVAYDAATEEANRRVVATFLNLAFNAGQLELALDLYVSPDYVQHNPLIPDGAQPVLDAFAAGKIPALCYDIQHVLVQNDLVFVFSRVTSSAGVSAVVDLIRVRDGVMVEHWDVVQAVPDDADMPHDNGMF